MSQELTYKIKFEDLIQKMQDDLLSSGKMLPVPASKSNKFNRRMCAEADALREIALNVLPHEWDNYFPGVPFSKELLAKKVDKIIAECKSEKISSLKALAKDHEEKAEYSLILMAIFVTNSHPGALVMCSVGSILFSSFVLEPNTFTVWEKVLILGVPFLSIYVAGGLYTWVQLIKKSRKYVLKFLNDNKKAAIWNFWRPFVR